MKKKFKAGDRVYFKSEDIRKVGKILRILKDSASVIWKLEDGILVQREKLEDLRSKKQRKKNS